MKTKFGVTLRRFGKSTKRPLTEEARRARKMIKETD